MKIRFKKLGYQKDSVQAVVDCFEGQPPSNGHRYMIDQGVAKSRKQTAQVDMLEETLDLHGGKANNSITDFGFKNAEISSLKDVLTNIQKVQAENGLQVSPNLVLDDNGKGFNLTKTELNLDIEMETGTGKTYCYIRTMFELNRKYGWSKFIIVVPSIAIREGVYKSLSMMADHFQEEYKKKARFFIYDSKALHHLESFSSNSGINVMIINVQAFNATGKDNRRIYEELDEFQSRKPIDVISRNRPILILDEPQKMGADKTLQSLSNFKPLFILRYSATHKRNYNLIYRLDALDAYNQKLVKKITVKGVEVQGLTGTHGYLYLQDIIVSKSAPVARLELEIATKNGFKREIRKVIKGDNLYDISHSAEQYNDRYVVSDIDARDSSITFLNGLKVHVGDAVGHVDEKIMRTIQIRETIRAHIQKERQLYNQGIKVLSLFFIDEVAKYRQYDKDNNSVDGEYVEIFKEQYKQVVNEILELNLENDPYFDYLQGIDVDRTHNGYFSIDKKKCLIDPKIKKVKDEELGISVGQADDVDAYDLILKDKERLLSFDEPTRFIFSHSALREGWDNPNVFVICTLKHSDNMISRRQEVGRGMRLAVNKFGERMDANHFQGALGEIHKLNNLTVVTNESYKEFVSNLQTEILNSISSRPTQATADYFKGKSFKMPNGSTVEVTELMAKQINKHLYKHEYIDDNDQLTPKYHEAKEQGVLAQLPENLVAYSEQIHKLVDSLFDPNALKELLGNNGNKKLTNDVNQANLDRKEFKELWSKINRKAVYQINLDSEKLIEQSISAVERTAVERNNKFVETLTYKLAEAAQNDDATYEQVKDKEMFGKVTSKTELAKISINSQVSYDLVGNVADSTNLTRKTVARILQGINAAVFAQFKLNPEAFIREMCRIVNEQQAKMVIQGLKYNTLDSTYHDNEIFVTNDSIPSTSYKADRHVWEYVVTDSDNERKFVEELDGADEVVVYAKLPDRFKIPTPFGNYNPDWAIAFDKDKVRQIYFIAETKGSVLDGDLRGNEKSKIKSAEKFFATLNLENESLGNPVQYSAIDSFSSLMKLIK